MGSHRRSRHRWRRIAVCALIGLAGCYENLESPGPFEVVSRFAVTLEAQAELEACVGDHFSPDEKPTESLWRNATALCEAILGIGSAGITAVSWNEIRPAPSPPPTTPPSATPRSVPESWRTSICQLERGDGEAELEAALGRAPFRTPLAGGGLLLQWEEGSAGVSAHFDERGLERVEAISENRFPKLREKIEAPGHWQIGVTQLSEVEEVLGEGIVVRVRWERGLPVPLDKARERGLTHDMVTAGCRTRVAWPRLQTGLGNSLSFRDGVLKGVL
jgi:hypothetical protein